MYITRKQFEDFKKFYTLMSIKAPDYRVGQAFLNFFPEVSKAYAIENTLAEFTLFNERCSETAWKVLESFVHEDDSV